MGSPYGMRSDPFTGQWTMHNGIDLNVPNGRDVFSIGSGIIKETGLLENYGIYIMIIHEGGYISLYGHLSQVLVQQGQRVEQGQIIAKSGNTGHSTGPHLHLEIRKDGQLINPADLIGSP
jgi:murein DD-endopeptidase MepM/ murein hydrolase activator NlpD